MFRLLRLCGTVIKDSPNLSERECRSPKTILLSIFSRLKNRSIFLRLAWRFALEHLGLLQRSRLLGLLLRLLLLLLLWWRWRGLARRRLRRLFPRGRGPAVAAAGRAAAALDGGALAAAAAAAAASSAAAPRHRPV